MYLWVCDMCVCVRVCICLQHHLASKGFTGKLVCILTHPIIIVLMCDHNLVCMHKNVACVFSAVKEVSQILAHAGDVHHSYNPVQLGTAKNYNYSFELT